MPMLPRRRDGAHTHPTERTPLLAGSSRPRDVSPDEPSPDTLPHVGSFVAEMRSEDLHKYVDDNLFPPILHSQPLQVSFSLCALLYFRNYLREAPACKRDVWAQWRQEQHNTAAVKEVESLIETVWEKFIGEEGSPEELSDVLWTAYPIYPDSRRTIRVVEFLMDGEIPHELMTHSLIYLSLLDIWKHGRNRHPDRDAPWSRLLQFIDSTGSPRALHIVDTTFYVLYLGVLGSYLVNPPVRAEIVSPDFRSAFIPLYALSRLSRPWALSGLPFALILVAFAISIPTTPFPDTFSYTLLLVAFCWKAILIHLPTQPNPFLLLSPDCILPLMVLVRRGVVHAFVPVVLFFIPGLLISFFLLSISISDIFLWLSTVSLLSSSPMETRVVFLSLFTLIFIFLCCALGFSVLVHPFLIPTDGSLPLTWDRYSKSVGLEARQVFVRVVATYTASHYFPAPLNLVQVFLVQLPLVAVTIAGWKAALPRIKIVDEILWRFLIAPLSFVVSAFWLWDLPGRW